MKINLTLDGTPNLLRHFIRDGLIEGGHHDPTDATLIAHAALETAVKDGGVTILLGEVTETRKL